MNPVEKSPPTFETLVRDTLAQDRTVLANERTLLAYIRTALALSGAGATFITFFQSWAMAVVGWVLAPLGAITLAVGIWRYLKTRAMIASRTGQGKP